MQWHVRNHFPAAVLATLLGLSWLSYQVQSSPALHSSKIHVDALQASRGSGAVAPELVELLDRIISQQQYHRSIEGRFADHLEKLGIVVPGSILADYRIEMAEAGRDRLLVEVYARNAGQIPLLVVDQAYRVQASVPLPEPRAEFLRAQALRQIRLIQQAPKGQLIEEQGIYRGYFKYEAAVTADQRKSVFAIGVRPPVLGAHLDGKESFWSELSRNLAQSSTLVVESEASSPSSSLIGPAKSAESEESALEIEPIEAEK